MDTEFTQRTEPKAKATLDAALAPIRRSFLNTIIQRVLRFEAMKQNLEAGIEMTESLNAVANLAHKMAGVAATLGFGEIGTLAQDVDRTVTSGILSDKGPAATWLAVEDKLEALLDAMEAQLDE